MAFKFSREETALVVCFNTEHIASVQASLQAQPQNSTMSGIQAGA